MLELLSPPWFLERSRVTEHEAGAIGRYERGSWPYYERSNKGPRDYEQVPY